MATRAFKVITVLISICFMSCTYSFRGSLPTNIKSVQVEQFRSRVTEYGLEQEITSLITESIVKDGRLSIDNNYPDARITGSITHFTRTAVTYTSGEDVEQYKLELRVLVSMDNVGDNEYIIGDEVISEWLLYDPSVETLDAAKQRLLVQLADAVTRRCLSGW